jgi:iron complex transport system ATP-binding protein
MLQAEHLNFSYGNKCIIKNVSFQIKKGMFCIIIGPNGAGKSTLLRIMAGIEKKFTGRFLLNNQPLDDYSCKDLARIIAYVPQQTPAYPFFKVKDFVLLGRSPQLGLLGVTTQKDNDIALRAMEVAGVDRLKDRYLTQLSGGELKRTYIARALCNEPQILLMDEPTAHLDMAHQIMLMNLMKQLTLKHKITVVQVSHELNLVSRYGDFFLLIKSGQCIRKGSVLEVFNEKILKEVYECNLLVKKLKETNVFCVVPL